MYIYTILHTYLISSKVSQKNKTETDKSFSIYSVYNVSNAHRFLPVIFLILDIFEKIKVVQTHGTQEIVFHAKTVG